VAAIKSIACFQVLDHDPHACHTATCAFARLPLMAHLLLAEMCAQLALYRQDFVLCSKPKHT